MVLLACLICAITFDDLEDLLDFIGLVKLDDLWVLSDEFFDVRVDFNQLFVDVTCEL